MRGGGLREEQGGEKEGVWGGVGEGEKSDYDNHFHYTDTLAFVMHCYACFRVFDFFHFLLEIFREMIRFCFIMEETTSPW